MTRKAGSVSAQTKTKLLEAAAAEFYQHGFAASSLRRICEQAQVTTGALYFFFQNKDDLFRAVISRVTVPLYSLIENHCRSEQAAFPDFDTLAALDPAALEQVLQDDEDDVAVFENIVHFYYQNKTLVDIVLQNQDHPAVKQFMDDIVALTTRQIMLLFEMIGKIKPRTKPLDPFAVHWLAHLQIESALGLMSHDFTEEEAVTHARSIINILRGGFFSLL